jgi:hypothetical protein
LAKEMGGQTLAQIRQQGAVGAVQLRSVCVMDIQ